MNTPSFRVMRFASAAFAMTLLAFLSGCVYVHPARRNPAYVGTYTRAESFPAEQRLVDALLADSTFAQHYAAKIAGRGGAVPVVQVSHIDNFSTVRRASLLAAVRRDIETSLRSSGRFILSGDPDACDYILRGEYRDIADGWRVTHQLALRLHDTAADTDVWTGADEIAKEYLDNCHHGRCVHSPWRRHDGARCCRWFWRRQCFR